MSKQSRKDPVRRTLDAVRAAGGKVDEVTVLPDGSGFATASLPLPHDHWLYVPGTDDPPMSLLLGTAESAKLVVVGRGSTPVETRAQFEERIRLAARYAIRAATLNGTEPDFDPDALVQCLIIGLLGYATPTGYTELE